MNSSFYDHLEQPAAPKCEIRVSTNLARIINKGSDVSFPTKMLLDTGANVSLVPRGTIEKLEDMLGTELPFDIDECKGFNGHITMHKVYYLTVHIQSAGIDEKHSIEVLECEDDEGILGRDILNLYHLCFDGPNKKITLTK